MMINTKEELAKYIDFTNLDNSATQEEIEEFCQTAKEYGFYSVVVSPYYVKLASEILKDSDIKVGTVVGFPLGFSNTKVKVTEAKIAIEDGADEIDMVAHIPAFKNRDYELLKGDINAVKEAIGDKVLKVIIETNLLNEGEITKISQEVNKTKAEFIKTNTGFTGINTFNEMILYLQLIKTAANKKEMKASGGIKNYKIANRLLSSGISRIGTSSGVDIIEQLETLQKNENGKPEIIKL